MATGLAIPIRLSNSGGFLTESGDKHASSILRAALGDDDNRNPFQQNIGLGVSMVFDIADAGARPNILNRLVRLFNVFEQQKRFKLRRNTIRWVEGTNGDMTMTFKYVNLESDEEAVFRESARNIDGGTNPGEV